MGGSRKAGIVSAVALVVVIALAAPAGAGWIRKSRNVFDPIFNPIQVCRDGIRFALGTGFNTSEPPALGTTTTEEVNLQRASDGTPVLAFESSTIPVIPLSEVPDPPGPDPESADGSSDRVAFALFTQPWAGGAQLTPGENLVGDLGLLGGTPEILLTIPEGSDDPIVVGDCRLFEPPPTPTMRSDAVLGFNPNYIVPWFPYAVLFAVYTDPGFDAATLDGGSVKVGAASSFTILWDIDSDGDRDLVGAYTASHTGLRCTDRSVTISARTKAGAAVTSTDSVKPVFC